MSTPVSETGDFVAETGDFVAVSGNFVAVSGDYSFGNKMAFLKQVWTGLKEEDYQNCSVLYRVLQ